MTAKRDGLEEHDGPRTAVAGKPARVGEAIAGPGHGGGRRADAFRTLAAVTSAELPRGANGADIALHYAMADSGSAGAGEGLRIARPQFGEDDGTGGRVNLLKLNQSVLYSLLIRKRYPAGVRAQGA